jgi:CDP-2,3-bis-(O-geranylgeranyl)-sn-glycerol synthase
VSLATAIHGAELLGVVYLLAPLLGGAVVHGVCMRQGWLAFLARPMDFGRTWRGRAIFGHSKTFRGPLLVAAGSAAVYALQRQVLHGVPAFASIELVDYAQLPGVWFAALAGAVGELGELPNSFVKRRLGIAPGDTARGARSVLFYLWDQVDVVLGYWLVWAWVVPATPLRLAASLLVAGAIHPLLTFAGYLLGMRPTAR